MLKSHETFTLVLSVTVSLTPQLVQLAAPCPHVVFLFCFTLSCPQRPSHFPVLSGINDSGLSGCQDNNDGLQWDQTNGEE